MTDDAIPDDVRDFILRHIDSIAQLELLLLLRAHKGVEWDVPHAAARVYSSEAEAKEVLNRLCAIRALSCRDEHYRYEEGSELHLIVERLADVYRRHLIPVTNLIHSKPRRIREFADAFKFRKEE